MKVFVWIPVKSYQPSLFSTPSFQLNASSVKIEFVIYHRISITPQMKILMQYSSCDIFLLVYCAASFEWVQDFSWWSSECDVFKGDYLLLRKIQLLASLSLLLWLWSMHESSTITRERNSVVLLYVFEVFYFEKVHVARGVVEFSIVCFAFFY